MEIGWLVHCPLLFGQQIRFVLVEEDMQRGIQHNAIKRIESLALGNCMDGLQGTLLTQNFTHVVIYVEFGASESGNLSTWWILMSCRTMLDLR